jgi:hypothetical protein
VLDVGLCTSLLAFFGISSWKGVDETGNAKEKGRERDERDVLAHLHAPDPGVAKDVWILLRV